MCAIPRGMAYGRTALSKRIDFDVGGLALEGPELKTGPGLQQRNNFDASGHVREGPGLKTHPGQLKRWILAQAGSPGLKTGPGELKSSILI